MFKASTASKVPGATSQPATINAKVPILQSSTTFVVTLSSVVPTSEAADPVALYSGKSSEYEDSAGSTDSSPNKAFVV